VATDPQTHIHTNPQTGPITIHARCNYRPIETLQCREPADAEAQTRWFKMLWFIDMLTCFTTCMYVHVMYSSLVEAVRATLWSFGSDSSKSTKFGPDIPYTIPFRFFEGAKKSNTRGRHIGKIQYGRQSFQPQVVFKQPKGVKWRVIPLFVGYLSRRVRFWS